MSNNALIDKILEKIAYIEETWYNEESSSSEYCVPSDKLTEYLQSLKIKE